MSLVFGYILILICFILSLFLSIAAGIPAPIYFGALIDRTCLHWGTLKCGEPGACRMYNINNFR